jgi:hypothetical protein
MVVPLSVVVGLFWAAFSAATPASVEMRQQRDAAAIERYREALHANPDDNGARAALKRFIDRPDPVPRAQDERIREVLRDYPWPGKARLAFEDEPGQPLVVSGVVRNAGGQPVKGAVLYLFQTDTNGHYTRAAVMDEPHSRLFAFIGTSDDGQFEFATIRPGGYPGRPDRQGEQWRIPSHVHFAVTAEGHQPRSFQMVFSDDPRMTPYWHEWARKGSHPVVPISRDTDGVQRAVCDVTLQ